MVYILGLGGVATQGTQELKDTGTLQSVGLDGQTAQEAQASAV